MAIDINILSSLNEEQRNAVMDIYGPVMIIAGPGSGKTTCLVARTVYMLNNGINPENILLFTFTRKAANEIKVRLYGLIGKEANKISIGTYHSICNSILKKYYRYVGLDNNFVIYDDEDSKKLVKNIISNLKTDITVNDAYNEIKKLKKYGYSIYNANAIAKNYYEKTIANIYSMYENELNKNNAVDFENLILKVIFILRSNADIRRELTNKYKYIISDETQDSSISDLELIRLLTGEEENLCLIGDDDQSIYGFRGANVEAVMNMRNIYPKMRLHILKINYRSTKTLVNACCKLIKNNKKDYVKELTSNNEQGNPILLFEETSSKAEGIRVVSLIKLCVEKYNLKYNDIAILYRYNYLTKDVENALFKFNIPYKIIQGINIYERKEIKDITCFFSFILNNKDSLSFKRIFEVIKKGVGEKTVNNIINYSSAYENNLLVATCHYLETKELKSNIKKGIMFFLNIIEEIKETMTYANVTECIEKVLELTSYFDNNINEDNEDKKTNIYNFIDMAAVYDSIEELMDNLNCMVASKEENDDDNYVKLLTMHNAKGLEFNVVIIIDAIEGIVPSSKAISLKDIEEERRIFYVACTRAKKLLFFIVPKYTMMRGKNIKSTNSRFINEIDKEFIFKCENKK